MTVIAHSIDGDQLDKFELQLTVKPTDGESFAKLTECIRKMLRGRDASAKLDELTSQPVASHWGAGRGTALWHPGVRTLIFASDGLVRTEHGETPHNLVRIAPRQRVARKERGREFIV